MKIPSVTSVCIIECQCVPRKYNHWHQCFRGATSLHQGGNMCVCARLPTDAPRAGALRQLAVLQRLLHKAEKEMIFLIDFFVTCNARKIGIE